MAEFSSPHAISESGAISSPISKLVPELLSAVFEAGCNFHHYDAYGLSFPIIVSHVCQRWRSTALATPRIWTCLSVRHKDTWELNEHTLGAELARLDALLQRSCDCMLRVQLHFSYTDDVLPNAGSALLTIIERLARHAGRWRSLTVDLLQYTKGLSTVFDTLCASLLAASNLTHMHLCILDTNAARHRDLVPAFTEAIDAPLAVVRLTGMFTMSWVPTFAHIVELELFDAPDEMVEVTMSYTVLKACLSNAPCLTRLVIVGDVQRLVPENAQPIRPSGLRVIVLSFKNCGRAFVPGFALRLLQALEGPKLEELTIDNLNIRGELNQFLRYLTTHPRTAYAHVRKLQLSYIWDFIDRRVADAFPSIESITLKGNEDGQLLDHLARVRHPSKAIAQDLVAENAPWPSLRQIAAPEAAADTLLAVVRNCKEWNCPLETVETDLPLTGNPRDYDSPPQRHAVRRLKEFVHLEPFLSPLTMLHYCHEEQGVEDPEDPADVFREDDDFF